MDTELETLIERWTLAFLEPPILVDAELMRRVLADLDATGEKGGG